MKINLQVKLHNKFEIEVKDIATGEIVQRGYAENIVLNNFFTVGHSAPVSIKFGEGSGTLDPSRTTLFQEVGVLTSSTIDTVLNQAPLPSYSTKKVVLIPTAYVGKTLTEVGLFSANALKTHALIKDSEGNPLALGPKTDTQEITIYATVYLQPNFEDGITFAPLYTVSTNNRSNGLLAHLLFMPWLIPGLNVNFSGLGANIRMNESIYTNVSLVLNYSNGVYTSPVARIPTETSNTKLRTVDMYPPNASTNATYSNPCSIGVNFETLAQNNSEIWGGHNFINKSIAVGDGTTVGFNLPWDEARLDKAKAVYADGILQATGVTWAAGTITFDTAPTLNAVITADYWVDYIPKDSDHVLDLQFSILYGEGTPS